MGVGAGPTEQTHSLRTAHATDNVQHLQHYAAHDYQCATEVDNWSDHIQQRFAPATSASRIKAVNLSSNR